MGGIDIPQSGQEKLFEAHLFMTYEEIKDEVKRVLDYALNASGETEKA